METKPTKTMKAWIDELPSAVREKVMYYNEVQGYEYRLGYDFTSGIAAMALAFNSGQTPEGSVYWATVAVDFYKPVY